MGSDAWVEYMRADTKMVEFGQLYDRAAGDRAFMVFSTPTSFRRLGKQIVFPLPDLVFQSVLRKWNAFSPIKLDISADFGDILVTEFDLRTRMIRYSDAPIKGFVGKIDYYFREFDSGTAKMLGALALFARYSGVGYKTTMGMGRVGFVKLYSR